MKTTILLLEPRDDCREAYADALRAAGFDVVTVHDAAAALDARARPAGRDRGELRLVQFRSPG